MASKGQSVLKEKKPIPAKCVRTHLGAFERTHGRTQKPRLHAGPVGPNGSLRSKERKLRLNARPVRPSRHNSYLRSNVYPTFDHK
jgi:hypothetical protein